VVQCCDDIIDMSALHADSWHAEHQADDPHVWTRPNNVIAIARSIGQELSKLDSNNTDRYQQATTSFIQRLSELDQQIGKLTRDLSKRKLIVSHPAWSFYAAEYGFEQISIEQNGKDIQASSLRNLIRQAQQDNIKAVFTQPQFNDKAARIIATELGGKVYSLDPLAYDYIENMLITTRLIVDGLADE
ncbi:MAG: zinc ABC transporter substrate-binding protein, partial [Gammaproteobacteria bacterium]